jgi:hypothetical protein
MESFKTTGWGYRAAGGEAYWPERTKLFWQSELDEFAAIVEEFRLIVVAERLSIPEPRQRQSPTTGS